MQVARNVLMKIFRLKVFRRINIDNALAFLLFFIDEKDGSHPSSVWIGVGGKDFIGQHGLVTVVIHDARQDALVAVCWNLEADMPITFFYSAISNNLILAIPDIV